MLSHLFLQSLCVTFFICKTRIVIEPISLGILWELHVSKALNVRMMPGPYLMLSCCFHYSYRLRKSKYWLREKQNMWISLPPRWWTLGDESDANLVVQLCSRLGFRRQWRVSHYPWVQAWRVALYTCVGLSPFLTGLWCNDNRGNTGLTPAACPIASLGPGRRSVLSRLVEWMKRWEENWIWRWADGFLSWVCSLLTAQVAWAEPHLHQQQNEDDCSYFS